jgi:hypothetical protein
MLRRGRGGVLFMLEFILIQRVRALNRLLSVDHGWKAREIWAISEVCIHSDLHVISPTLQGSLAKRMCM